MKKQNLALLGLLFISACTSQGGTDNPLLRPYQYFSYVNGDDIRAACDVGAESRYRFVFNALYEQQVRTYDIRQGSGSKHGIQDTRVFSRGVGAAIDISGDDLDFRSNFHSTEPLEYDDLLAIDRALISSGFEQPTENGQILHSDEFYWVAMVCREGAFKYFAWSKDKTDIEKLPFTGVLSKGDTTGVKVAPIKEPVIHNRGGRHNSGGFRSGTYFSLEVGDNGLKL